jgi:hypothetical protein
MNAYSVLPTTPDSILAAYGEAGSQYEQSLLTAMRMLVVGYQGGAYELRRYPNGAHALVNPSLEIHHVGFMNNNTEMTLEAASLLANCIVAGQLCELFYTENNQILNLQFHDLTHGLKDSINNRIRFVIDKSSPEGTRDPTNAEIQKTLELAAHPYAKNIIALLD